MVAAKKRKAWVITIDSPRRTKSGEIRFDLLPGVPLAVLPVRTPIREVMRVVDGFAQLLNGYPSDMVDYLKKDGAPYAARKTQWGQEVEGSHSPHYVQAFRVDDLRAVVDAESGQERFEYTRRPAVKPQWVVHEAPENQ